VLNDADPQYAAMSLAEYNCGMFPADEHPFLAAIVARPADDEPRLVYADYLDETGAAADAARAELIRLQIALHRLPQDDARRVVLAERESELLETHRAAWTAPLARLGAKFQFRRGLPDAVALDAAAFLERGEELFDNTAYEPGRTFLTRVRLNDAARSLPALAMSSLLRRVQELDLGGSDLGNGGLAALLASRHLGNIRLLELGQNRLDDAAAGSLARSASLPRLESLLLNDNEIGGDGAAALAASPFLAGLVELDLSGNDVNEAGVRALASGFAAHRLSRLRLADNPIRDGLVELAGSALFARLAANDPHLDLHRCGIEPAGAAALAANPSLNMFEQLNLDENYLGDAGVAALARGRLDSLRTLRLVRNQITDAGADALLAASLPKFELLDVSSNRLTQRGVDRVKSAARDRGFTVVTANNGTETMIALPPRPAAQSELDRVRELKRGMAHPMRPGS
jgi:uncharacterized protein (TIGR02996 family)